MCTLDRIIELLREQRKNQIELTSFLNLNKSAFTDWKNGKSKSYEKHLPKIAKFFDVSVDYLLGNTNIKKISSGEKAFSLSDHDIKFALFNGEKEITDEMYEEVKRFAQFIVNKKNADKR